MKICYYYVMKKTLVLGILAHVDAGKTTLSEALLYAGGTIRSLGRVDQGNAYLDTDTQERARGITIFSKQANIDISDELMLTLIDTPGHVDFSAEMERALSILDFAVLVISGPSGVQSHTKTLWKLLRAYNVPTIIFVNKMDMSGVNLAETIAELHSKLSLKIVDFSKAVGCEEDDEFYEELASCDEALMDEFLESGKVSHSSIVDGIKKRNIFPLVSGSALRYQGIDELVSVIQKYMEAPSSNDEFGAYCYKITRDEKNTRLTHIKVTGGSLRVKSSINDEKINEIRLYSGNKYTAIQEATAGMVVALTGLNDSKPGMNFGKGYKENKPILEPVLSYAIRYPRDVDATQMLNILKEVEDQLPELQVEVDDEHREIRVSLMGTVQTEIITELIRDKYNIAVTFDVGSISYKETIEDVVEGVGHFEPLRHYAEVHLRLEPLETGMGMQFDSEVSEDLLDKNWQRLIMTHLEERVHRGVLTGSPITDMKITIVGGRAHNKHTEGGDFRQATYRAVRQGLMQASSKLLEPYYDYTLTIPEALVGRAMTDIDRMNGTSELTESADGIAVLNGRAPVATMHTYATEVAAYTKGEGILSLSASGYAPCHNEEEVIASRRYNPDADNRNPSSSVFCSHGAGTVIPWDQVFDYMHVPSCINGMKRDDDLNNIKVIRHKENADQLSIGTDEIDEILNKVAYSNTRNGYSAHKGISADRARANREAKRKEAVEVEYKGSTQKDKYLLVDGYNAIFAWQELKELAKDNIDSAKDSLLDSMCNYQGFTGEEVIVVFDAYKVPNKGIDAFDYHNIHVIYTRTAQTADMYIERFAHNNSRKYDITVASSDGMVQIITRGDGCRVVSSRELEQIVNSMHLPG